MAVAAELKAGARLGADTGAGAGDPSPPQPDSRAPMQSVADRRTSRCRVAGSWTGSSERPPCSISRPPAASVFARSSGSGRDAAGACYLPMTGKGESAMKIGVTLGFNQHTPPADVLAVARAAEERAFHSLWVPEHVLFFREYASRYPYSDTGRIPGPDGRSRSLRRADLRCGSHASHSSGHRYPASFCAPAGVHGEDGVDLRLSVRRSSRLRDRRRLARRGIRCARSRLRGSRARHR